MVRGPLKGGSPGESTKPSCVKEFVIETDPEIDSFALSESFTFGVGWFGVASRIKEGINEVININLFVSNTKNSGPATIINYIYY